jgi:hypothetical protein
MHLYLAHQVAQQLDWGYLHDHLGSCWLGSSAPDVRAMTHWPRERTHFAPLSVQRVGEGARAMFQRHPELAGGAKLPPATRAFLLGYVSHLAADEVWITTVFRPHFDVPGRVTATEEEAHIWDRALQLDMDRQARRDMPGFSQAAAALACAQGEVSVAFIEAKVLQEWREWVHRFLGWEFSWERLKRALNRMYRDNNDVQERVDRFLADMPRSLERVYATIPEEKLAAYQQQTLAETLALARQWLA